MSVERHEFHQYRSFFIFLHLHVHIPTNTSLSLSLSLSLCPCVCVCECMYVCFAYLRRVAAALLPAIHGTWVEAGIASVRHVHTSHFQDTHTKGKG